jgi:hypothetical protein
MNEIEFVHPFNKERKTLPVETIAKTYVAVRWGQSGIYDLNLAKNVLTARSVKAQRKGRCHWQAVDIQAVRDMVRIHLEKQDIKEMVREQRLAHEASMPGK